MKLSQGLNTMVVTNIGAVRTGLDYYQVSLPASSISEKFQGKEHQADDRSPRFGKACAYPKISTGTVVAGREGNPKINQRVVAGGAEVRGGGVFRAVLFPLGVGRALEGGVVRIPLRHGL